jgi:hypothetical protein
MMLVQAAIFAAGSGIRSHPPLFPASARAEPANNDRDTAISAADRTEVVGLTAGGMSIS